MSWLCPLWHIKYEVTVDYDQRGKYNLHEIKRVCTCVQRYKAMQPYN